MILVEDTPKHTVEDMGSRMMAVRLLLPVLVAQVTQSVLVSNTSPETYFCRNRGIYQNMTTFTLSSCSSCYGFLFPVDKELRSSDTWLISINGIHFKHLTYLVPDIHDTATTDMICQTLNHNECSDWLHCCKDAEKCCKKNKLLADEVHTQIFNTSICPETWDGFVCWDETRAKSIAVSQCPTFIHHGNPSRRAEKSCTANGSWFTQQSGGEWTDYTKCVELSDYKTQSIISVACNIASLLVLLPSIAICLAYRSLHVQLRIRLHIHLFLSFVIYSVVNILWDMIVSMDQLRTANSIMNQNTQGCRLLNVMTRYSHGTNFIWMFCEACFLHRLIVNAFEAPSSLLFYYSFGWGLPCVPVVIYSILRAMLYDNERCWIASIGVLEWLLYLPNLLSLGTNVIFLLNILRILLTQLQSHPNEPSNYRKALKATFVLVPLFGLQMLMVIYRPPGYHAYDIFAAFVTNTQGFFVALTLCLTNEEVLSLLRRSCHARWSWTDRRESQRNSTTVTSVTEGSGPIDRVQYSKCKKDEFMDNENIKAL